MKTLLITGGNDGIGFYMANTFLEQGQYVAVLDLNTDHITELEERYTQTLKVFSCDVRNQEAVLYAVEETKRAFKTIDYAVHNACVCPFIGFEEMEEEEYRTVMDVNFFGGLHVIKAVIPWMKEQKHGKIMLTSSGVGVTGFPGISAYAASKGALEAFAKCMNLEYIGCGITFHILHPPLTNTRSSSPLPVPKEFKASPDKVGMGLMKHIDRKKLVITPSWKDAFSVRISYQFPILMGKLLAKMTAASKEKKN